MIRTAGLMATLALIVPSAAQAVPMGIQDDGQSSMAVALNTEAIAGTWTRTTAYIGQPGVDQRIRDAHEMGLKIILTVGGTGTRSRKPSFKLALRYIQSLPRADKYAIDNEPDLDGLKPCTYRRGWMKARKVLGKRLLWGDFSPHRPLTYTQRARACGPLPKRLDVGVHPYQDDDPLAKSDPAVQWGDSEGGLGNLGYGKRWLKKNVGVSVTWWITEFGYINKRISDTRAAWLWPRAIKRAGQIGAACLVIYTAKGESWDSRPAEQAWDVLTGRPIEAVS